MTWETVLQALVLAAGAVGISRWMGREPRPATDRASADVLSGSPPRGHQFIFMVTSVRCECGWRWQGSDFTTQGRLRRELRCHLAAVGGKSEPSAPRAPMAAAPTVGAGSRYFLPRRHLGDPKNYCGRGICALGAGHSGSCST